MEIRRGGPADFEGLERLIRASFGPVYAYFAVRGLRSAHVLLVAEEGGTLLGFMEGVLFEGAPVVGYTFYVATDEAHRGKGVGRALVEAFQTEARSRGATRLFAAVARTNAASLALFRSLGYAPTPKVMLWRWYGWRAVGMAIRMQLAPHEELVGRE